MNLYVVQSNIIQGLVVFPHRLPFHQIQTFKAIQNSTENCILFVQFGKSGIGEEKLAPICVGT